MRCLPLGPAETQALRAQVTLCMRFPAAPRFPAMGWHRNKHTAGLWPQQTRRWLFLRALPGTASLSDLKNSGGLAPSTRHLWGAHRESGPGPGWEVAASRGVRPHTGLAVVLLSAVSHTSANTVGLPSHQAPNSQITQTPSTKGLPRAGGGELVFNGRGVSSFAR